MRKITLFIIIILLFPAAAFAHPHMFIDMQVNPVFSEKGFEGVKIRWLFDMVFTGSVLMDNSIGWKEKFSDEEIKVIRDTSFINLINYNYYTYFNIDGHFSRPKSFRDFYAFMSENRLGYEFFLPCPDANRGSADIRIAVYDDSFFCDIAYAEDEPVSVDAPDRSRIDWMLSEQKDAPIYYDNTAQMVSREGATYSGQAFPIELVLKVKN